MKLLVLSFYFTPDLCAGSFRCEALVKALSELDIEIEVVTTLPNRYKSFSAEAQKYENNANVSIHRIALPTHDSGMFDQARAFHMYYNSAREFVADKSYDAVFATSSRLFSAFLGARIARKMKLPLYLDIRDIFVDTLDDVLPAKVTWAALPILRALERYTFTTARCINLVSPGFAGYFESRYPSANYRWFTNGIDSEFLNVSPRKRPTASNARVKILYAGNIGEGQGLHRIIPELAFELRETAEFKIIGAGGRYQELQSACQSLDNVTLIPPVRREELINIYLEADVLFLHLNDYEAFRKVLPSKIFEYAALGKPILAGVSGYAEQFLKENVSNCVAFEPGNKEQAVMKYHELTLADTDRSDFIHKFARSRIMKEMARDIFDFMQRKPRYE